MSPASEPSPPNPPFDQPILRPQAPSLIAPVGGVCRICDYPASRHKPLYGTLVCRSCWLAFVNRRYAACLIDVLVYQMVLVALSYVFWSADSSPGYAPPLLAVWCLAELAFLFVFPLRDEGASPGKLLCGLRVIDRTTRKPIGIIQSYKRNVVLLIPVVGIIVPVLQLTAGPRWGDGWANTVVIWRKYAHKLPFDPRGTYCLGCGYDLTGNVSGVCPECGTPVPAARPLVPSV